MSDHNPASRPPATRARAGWLAAAFALAATAAAAGPRPLGTIEECLESGTDLVQLPGVAGGSLSARECRGCSSARLEFGRNTRYFIGKQQVPYAKLREVAAQAESRLYVCFQPGTRTLTRLRLVAAASTQ